MLGSSASLRDLTVTARHQNIGPKGAHALARLGTLRQEHALTRNLHGNHIQKSGARGLAALSQSLTIRDLHLGLGKNKIGYWGAMALGKIDGNQPPHDSTPASLNALSLNMDGNELTDKGVKWLSRNWHKGTLKTIQISLADIDITDDMATSLARMKNSATLQEVSIDLSFNDVANDTARALASLAESNTITEVDLNLNDNNLTGDGAQALLTMVDIGKLASLTIVLYGIRIGPVGAQALKVLRNSQITFIKTDANIQ